MIVRKALNDVSFIPRPSWSKHLDLWARLLDVFVDESKRSCCHKIEKTGGLAIPDNLLRSNPVVYPSSAEDARVCTAQSFDPSRRSLWFHGISERDRRNRSQSGGPDRSLRRSSSAGRFYLLT